MRVKPRVFDVIKLPNIDCGKCYELSNVYLECAFANGSQHLERIKCYHCGTRSRWYTCYSEALKNWRRISAKKLRALKRH